jgi:hypothetical protein
MKLFELAYSCRLYRGQFDDAYDRMRKALGIAPDLSSPEQQYSLMRFLNDWRCRIPEKNFPTLKERLQQWATLWISQLPEPTMDIRSLTEDECTQIGKSYEALLNLGAGLNFQDTAAAKTLHALRPKALAIYDHNDPAPPASNHFWGGYFLWEGNDFLDHAIRSYLKLAGRAHRRWTGDATRGKGVNSCPSTKNTGPGK